MQHWQITRGVSVDSEKLHEFIFTRLKRCNLIARFFGPILFKRLAVNGLVGRNARSVLV